jgi:hypothetical protein
MKQRRKDSGFAMLLVFLMAACIAITLYTEVPRVAFEAERQRELLLVDRGNQFKRAIQVFVTDKTNNPMRRFPATLDELESFNGHRYLRHRYVDPMTGKDEWRLVHMNGGILTDSVTTQANPNGANGMQGGAAAMNGPGAGSSTSSGPEFISSQAFMDAAGANGSATGGVTRALNRRPSDGLGAPGGATDPNNPGGPPLQNAGGTGTNGTPSIPGAPGANPPGMPVLPGQSGAPGGLTGSIPGGMPGSGLPGGMPGNTTNSQPQQPAPTCFIGDCGASSSTSGQPAAGQSGAGALQQGGAGAMPGFGAQTGSGNALSAQQSAASNMIGALLTTPRPGGMPTGMPGATVGGGIAGVASKYEAEGIMVINQRTKINEWEYIFDPTKWRAPPNPVTGPPASAQPGMAPNGGTPIGSPAGTPIGGTPTGAGTTGTSPAGPGGGGQGQ